MFDPQLLQMMMAQQGRGMQNIKEQKPWSKHTCPEKLTWLLHQSIEILSKIAPWGSVILYLSIVGQSEENLRLEAMNSPQMGMIPPEVSWRSRLLRMAGALVPIPKFGFGI
mmetsp:Transcript_11349/g.42577  ORF Transcript_11349/g.42577 Transcript_11349/m.42577 type:complete len:111 (-) Transcript_11349:2230-2562(-)